MTEPTQPVKMPSSNLKMHVQLEIIWWTITIIVALGVLLPIYQTKPDFPFWLVNILFIVSFITLSRYLFLLKHTFLAKQQWLKVAVAVLSIPLFLYLFSEFSEFRVISDEVGLRDMFGHMSVKGQTTMSKYVQSEMLFFGTGSVIGAALMPFRMIISFWRTHNRGTV